MKNKQRPLAEALEKRLLYSADPISAVFDMGDLETSDDKTPSLIDAIEHPLPFKRSAATDAISHDQLTNSDELALLETHTSAGRLELVFVDTNTPNYQQLLDDVLSQSNTSRTFEVIVIDSHSDGVAVIGDSLENYKDLDAIHIISHGRAGALALGNAQLDNDYIQAQPEAFTAWANALTDSADILLYGCELASEQAGLQLMQSLASLTQADISASDDTTGHASLSGDWQLEQQLGNIETELALSTQLQADYVEILATFNGSSGADVLEGSTSADTLNGNGGNDILLGGVSLLTHGNLNSASTLSESNITSANSGWGVTSNSVDFLGTDSALLRPNDPNDSGIRAVDLNNGGIQRTIAGFTIGESYQVAFFMGADGAVTQSVDVEAVGLGVESVSVTMPSGNTLANMDWQAKSYTFTATATSHTLRFISTSGSASDGAIISAIRVVSLSAADGDDTFQAGAGNDLLIGGGGADTMYGNDGEDSLFGGDGDDVFFSFHDAGIDLLDGGEGSDRYLTHASASVDVIRDSGTTGTDLLKYQSSGGLFMLEDNFSRALTGIDQIQSYTSIFPLEIGDSTYANALNWDFTGINLLYVDEIWGGTQNDIITIDDTDPIILRGYAGDDILTDGDGDNTLYGDDGNDTIYAGGGDDTVHGNAGTDTLYGQAGADIFYANDDTETDTVDGGEGSDTYHVWRDNTAEAYRDSGTSGTDIVRFNSSSGLFMLDDTFTQALTGIDTIQGYNHGDYPTEIGQSSTTNALNWDLTGISLININELHGGTQADTLIADDTDTLSIYGYGGDDTIEGGAGITHIYAGTGNDTIDAGDGDNTIYGGDGNDSIQAGQGNNTVYAEAGNDSVDTGNGNNFIHAGTGHDTINTGTGDDTIYGDTGNDAIDAGDGNNSVHSQSGSDLILAGSGSNNLHGGDDGGIIFAGSDVLGAAGDFNSASSATQNASTGSNGLWTITQNNVDFLANGHNGLNIVGGGRAVDLNGDAGQGALSTSFTTVAGRTYSVGFFLGGDGAGEYSLQASAAGTTAELSATMPTGNTLANMAWAGRGFSFTATANTTTLSFSSTSGSATSGPILSTLRIIDTSATNINSNTLYGGDGSDVLSGAASADSLRGYGGVDYLFGGAGSDHFYANDDTDSDFVDGGDGSDTYASYDGNAAEIYRDTGSNGSDTLVYSSSSGLFMLEDNFSLAQNGIEALESYSNLHPAEIGQASHGNALDWDLSGISLQHISEIHGGTQADTITVDDTDTLAIYSYGGDDTITGSDGNNTIETGAGNDTIDAGQGDNTVDGGTGNDNMLAGNGNNTLYGDAGNDTIHSGSGNDAIHGGSGDDIIQAGTGNNTIQGDDGADTINTGLGNDTIDGGSGNDDIDAGAGDNTVSGQAGIDLILSGTGANILKGGDGGGIVLAGSDVLGAAGDFNSASSATQNASTGSNGLWTITQNNVDFIANGSAGLDVLGGGRAVDLNGNAGQGRMETSLTTVIGNTYTVGFFLGGDGEGSYTLQASAAGTTVDIAADMPTGNGLGNMAWAGRGFSFTANATTTTLSFSSSSGTTTAGPMISTVRVVDISSDTNANTLLGGDGDDLLSGAGAADTMRGYGGVDYIFGGAGNELFYTDDDADSDYIDGGDGGDTYYSYADNTTETYRDTGTSGVDTIRFNSQAGVFMLEDTFSMAQNGIEAIAGYSSSHKAQIGQASYGNALDWDLNGISLLDITEIHGGTQNDSISVDDTDTLAIYGYGGDDTIQGSDGINTVYAGSGNDNVYVGQGDNTVYGDVGDDTITALDGNNTIEGGSGNDTINTGLGNDTLDGGTGSDAIDAGAGDNTVTGQAGIDLILSGTGANNLQGGDDGGIIFAGSDILGAAGDFNSASSATQNASTGTNGNWSITQNNVDFLANGSGDLHVLGGGRAVDLNGTAGQGSIATTFNTVAGHSYTIGFFLGGDGTGSYSLQASAAGTSADISATMPGGNGLANMAWAGRGFTFNATAATTTLSFASTSGTATDGPIISTVRVIDTSAVNANKSTVSGGNDADVLSGGGGADTLRGYGGVDYILGGAGADLFYANDDTASDFIDGGDDADTYFTYANNAAEIYRDTGSSGTDTLIYGSNSGLFMLEDNFSLAQNGIEAIESHASTYPAAIGTGSHNTALDWNLNGISLLHISEIHGGTQNDSLSVDDTDTIALYGYSGDDTLTGSDGDNTIDAGTGDDVINAGQGNNTVYGQDGDDTITAGDGDNTIEGNGGDDTISVGTGHDTIDGGAGDDAIDAGAGNNTVHGDEGTDLILSGTGANTLIGGNGGGMVLAGSDILGAAGDFNGASSSTQSAATGTHGNWLVTQNNVDFLADNSGGLSVLGGGRAVDLNGDSGQGAIETSFSTVVGHSYTVGFFLGGDGSGDYSVQASAAGKVANISATMPASNGLANMAWAGRGFSFTATDTTTTLSIASTSGSTSAGPIVSTVRIVDTSAINNNDNTVTGGDGGDLLSGGGDADTLRGLGDVDYIFGGAGNDQFYANDDNHADVIDGGEGSDNYQVWDANTVEIYRDSGSSGTDTVRFNSSSGTFMLEDNFSQLQNGIDAISGYSNSSYATELGQSSYTSALDWDLTGISLSNITTIHGSSQNDSITISDTDTLSIYGYDGDDALSGSDGINTIHGGDGMDTIDGGNGDNILFGGLGDDTLIAGTGHDTIDGGSGDDTIQAGNGDNVVYGDDGNDTITAGVGNDSIDSGSGDDAIDAGAGNNSVNGQAGVDLILAGTGANDLQGGDDGGIVFAGSDILGAAGDFNTASSATQSASTGSNGNWNITQNNVDFIANGSGGLTVLGGGRAVDLNGNTGQGRIETNLTTVIGNSYTVGFFLGGDGDGDYSLQASAAGTTADISATMPVSNSLSNMAWAGRGFSFTATATTTTLAFASTSGTATDGPLVSTVRVIDTSYVNPNANAVYGGDGDDVLSGGGHTDRLIGYGGVDYVFGGAGADRFYANDDTSSDIVDGGEGADTYYTFDADTAETYRDTGTSGTDTLHFGSTSGVFMLEDNFSKAQNGIDAITGYSGEYTTTIGHSNHGDALNWDFSGINQLHIDEIWGGTQQDTLRGSDDDDTLYGGLANDSLYGGAGNDTAHFDGNYADYTISRISYTTTDDTGFIRVQETTVNGIDEGHDFVYGTVETLQFANGSYDTATGTFVLENN